MAGKAEFGPGNRGNEYIRAAGNNNLRTMKSLFAACRADSHFVGTEKSRSSLNELNIRRSGQFGRVLFIAACLNGIFVYCDFREIDANGARQATLGKALLGLVDFGGFPNGFGGYATVIKAVSAHHPFGVHHDHRTSRFSQSKSGGISAPSSADGQQVNVLNGHCTPPYGQV